MLNFWPRQSSQISRSAKQGDSCFSRWFLGSVQRKIVAFVALRSGKLYDMLYYLELVAPSMRGSISRMEWNLK